MEDSNSFDLNRAIQKWREHLAQSPALQRENLDELESHLRDSVASLQTLGLSGEEAFLIGARRIGEGSSLESEFAKINSRAVWLSRTLWMLIGAQLWYFMIAAIGTLARSLVYFGLTGLNYDFNVHGRGIPIALFIATNLTCLVGCLAFCWWLFSRKGDWLKQWIGKLLYRRTTQALTFGALCLLTFCNYGVNNFETTSMIRKSPPDMLWSISISAHTANLVQVATLLGLVLFLARKRIVQRTH